MATFQCRAYFAYGLVLLLLFTTVYAKKQYNNYYTHDIKTSCTLSKEQSYRLFSDGVVSAVKIDVPGSIYSQGNSDCEFTLSPSFDYGIILHIEKVKIIRQPCINFFEINRYVLEDYEVTEKFCDFIENPTWNFYSTKEMTLYFHTNLPSAISYGGFEIIATAYKRDCLFSHEHFLCDNGYCIWKGFACDGVNNCGDNSDEYAFGKSQCAFPGDDDDFIVPQTIWDEHSSAIVGVSVPLVIISVVCLMIRLCFACRRAQTTTGTTVRRRIRIYTRRNNTSRGDPPYTILPHETCSAPFDPPPPYTTVAISPQNYPGLIQHGTPSQPGISTLQGISMPQGMSTPQGTSMPQVASSQSGMPSRSGPSLQSGVPSRSGPSLQSGVPSRSGPSLQSGVPSQSGPSLQSGVPSQSGPSLQSGVPSQSGPSLQSGMPSQSEGPPQQEISSQLTNAESISKRY